MEIVSKNGIYKILGRLGTCLKINGEAIYDIRPWITFGEGNVRFTRNKEEDVVYAIFLEWSEEQLATLESMRGLEIMDVKMIGLNKEISWYQGKGGLVIKFPDYSERPCEDAYAFRVETTEEAMEEMEVGDVRLSDVGMSKEEVEVSEPFTISVTLKNISESASLLKVRLYVDVEAFGWRKVSVGFGESKEISFPIQLYGFGEHKIVLSMGPLTTEEATIKVKEESPLFW